ncbi:protein phosphatase 1, regulatory subunit [Rhizopus azygosporus]|uniref:Protein phosphatase 1, regulatory subunit n=1 Tax=Rhizopus azygosporus TaxID=86630 RepID=A0A367K6R2_RHIAZ|nr:protein phosphatase 1, regulatory subunit [Rhizopus azygosporus]
MSFYNKRIVLKRSIPYQPIYKQDNKKKSVRFNPDLEQTTYFYKTQPPKAIHIKDVIRAEDYTMTQINWPNKTRLLLYNDNKIRMEQIQLTDGDYQDIERNQFMMEGRCRALNISYQKTISVRYTFDLWSTYHETVSVFKESIASTSNTWDRFTFTIPIQASNQVQTVYFALRYTVDGQEYWDNNNGLNYQIIITPPPLPLHEKEKEQQQKIKKLSKRYDFSHSYYSPPPSPPITPTDLPLYTPFQDNKTELSYTDFVNKYCFYNSHSSLIYSTSPSAVFT